MTAKKKSTATTKKRETKPTKKSSRVLELAAALSGRADAWARAADLPDQDAALDALVKKAGARKRLTLDQIRQVFP